MRVTLGASRGNLRLLIVRQALLPVAVGAALGLVGALALSRAMAGLLFEVGATDPLTFIAVMLVLVTSAIIASYVPASRASAIDPARALRH